MLTLRGRRTLVTGATGFLGSNLARALTAAGADVHALARPGVAPPPDASVTWHHADLLDDCAVRQAMAAVEPEIVFHLAAYGARPLQHDADRMFAVNVEGTFRLWSALTPNVTRLVMTGTCSEYGRHDGPAREEHPCTPIGAYAVTKHAAVALVTGLARSTGRELVVLRPYGVFGPGDDTSRVIPSVIAGLLRDEVVHVTPGEQVRDFLYVDDHVDALLRAAVTPGLAPGSIYNVGSGIGRRLRDALEEVAALVPSRGRLEFGARAYREGEIPEMVPDIDAARRDLGFAPRVSFQEGVRRTAAWLQSR